MKETNNNNAFPSTKYSAEYLLAICGASEEKNMLMVNSLRRNELPAIDHRIRILEIGPGSGDSIQRLYTVVRELSLERQVQLVSLDLFDQDELNSESHRVQMLKNCSHVVSGKAQELPFEKETFSGINISAVLHEVYSYGGGLPVVQKTIREINRVLVPNGILCYRDSWAPDEDLMYQSIQTYKSPTWVAFLQHFLQDFLAESITPYADAWKTIRFYQLIDGDEQRKEWKDVQKYLPVCMDAPLGLQREIQRHYLTLREFLVTSGVLGFTMTDPQWKGIIYANQSTIVHLTKHDTLAEQLFQTMGKSKNTQGDYEIRGSLLFDKMIDIMMYRFFDTMDQGDEQAKNHFSLWQEREGKENYFYLGVADFLLEAAKQSLSQSNGEYVLLPSPPENIKLAPRYSYQSYLSTVLERPLFEGKQIIKFKKYRKKDAYDIIENLRLSRESYALLGKRRNDVLLSLSHVLST